MIDMNSSDSTCIYLTLMFVTEHAERYVVTPLITYNQPLWWKALMIINCEALESDLSGIILRLVGYHVKMSFLGCIGNTIVSHGLQELL